MWAAQSPRARPWDCASLLNSQSTDVHSGGSYSSPRDSDSRKALIDALIARRVETVISSGNSDSSTQVGAPRCISSAVKVGSTTKSDAMSSFSNNNSTTDLLAPGSGIVAAVPGTGFSSKRGTSMAAPHVAGAFAVLRSRKNSLTVAQALSVLQSAGKTIRDPRNNLTKRRIILDAAVNKLGSIGGSKLKIAWQKMKGSGKDIGVGTSGIPWVIGTNKEGGGYGIYKWNRTR